MNVIAAFLQKSHSRLKLHYRSVATRPYTNIWFSRRFLSIGTDGIYILGDFYISGLICYLLYFSPQPARTRAFLSRFSRLLCKRASRINRFPLPRNRIEGDEERASIYGTPNERVSRRRSHPNATQEMVRGWNQFSTVSI